MAEPVFGVRDAESLGLMPCQIGVFCDGCGTTVTHDYWVSEDGGPSARFQIARAHLRREEGWRCDLTGDWCPKCQPAEEVEP
jgi:hypothetical protein